MPVVSFAVETGDSCSSITDNEKRLECYDSVFKGGNHSADSRELKADQGEIKAILRAMMIRAKMLGGIAKLRTR